MNICMMTNTYLPHVGGVARSVQTFAEEYRKKGHQALVVAPTFPTNGDAPHSEDSVVRLPALQQFNGSDFSVRLPLTAVLNPILAEFPANVIHSHHPFLLGDSALRIAADKHAAVIFTHHTLYEQYTHYVPFDSTTMKQFIIDLSTNYANLCDGVIAPSESIAKIITDRGVTQPIAVIPTGIDTEFFGSGDRKRFRAEHNIPPLAFVVGHVGRLAPEKNLQYLMESVAIFLKQNRNAVFLVVGAGPSGDEIRDYFAREGLSDLLIMPGQLTGQPLADAYKAMNVFAFSSQSETQGMVLAEAMGAGLPVVALDASGVREVVRHDRNGILLPATATREEFAQALQGIQANADLRKRMKACARRTSAQFDRERCADRALQFYDEIRTLTRAERREIASDPWTSLLNRIRIEWELISQKAKSAVSALMTETTSSPPAP